MFAPWVRMTARMPSNCCWVSSVGRGVEIEKFWGDATGRLAGESLSLERLNGVDMTGALPALLEREGERDERDGRCITICLRCFGVCFATEAGASEVLAAASPIFG